MATVSQSSKRSFSEAFSTDAVAQLPGYEEEKCWHSGCKEWAKFELNGKALCGRHCNKKQVNRKVLDKSNYEAFQESFRKPRREAIAEAQRENRDNHRVGDVIVIGHKQPNGMRDVRLMLSHPSYRASFYRDGYLAVFPNFKHGNTPEGFGCKTLSPKDMGPVHHGMSNLPTAMSIENYHQFAKCFPCDVDENSNPTGAWFAQRARGYSDPHPHRHSPSAVSAVGNKNSPPFSVFYSETGEERRYTYLQCRAFYCVWYEKLAMDLPELQALKNLRQNGTNLQIVGYDGYCEGVTMTLWEHFNDVSRPFGHELVLYTLLTVESPSDYPWNQYRKEHAALYEGMLP